MRVLPKLLLFALLCLGTAGCRSQELYETDRAAMADPTRGERLFKANCAKTCHPASAFESKSVRDQRQLITTIRAYYERAMGDDQNYTRQDLYDLAAYLDRKHYRLPSVPTQETAPTP